jgi:aryl-alcohol dehydrogenase-like predicted oxidoreductase
MPDEGQAAAIVDAALDAGIRVFDTARDYGASEGRLGQLLADRLESVHIVTKLDPLRRFDGADDLQAIDDAVRDSVHQSLANLGVERLDTLLLHRSEHLTFGDGRIWECLRSLQSDGLIGALGVSVRTPEEARKALAMDGVAHLQLPLNPLDWRWRESGIPSQLHERRDVTVHVRSAYLQGLLVARDPSIWPKIEGVDPEAIYAVLDQLARVCGRAGAADLCLAY